MSNARKALRDVMLFVLAFVILLFLTGIWDRINQKNRPFQLVLEPQEQEIENPLPDPKYFIRKH